MRLFLSHRDGLSLILCPRCRKPLLLAQERRGYWRVGYLTGFRLRPGRQAMLVCPDMDCDHVEPVEIAASAADAVPYLPYGAAHAYDWEQIGRSFTLAEIQGIINDLRRRWKEGNRKAPSAIRYWRHRLRTEYASIIADLRSSYEQGEEIACTGLDWELRGRVSVLFRMGFFLTLSQTGDTVFISTPTLVHVTRHLWLPFQEEEQRFDFGGKPEGRLTHPHNLQHRFAVIAGHTVQLHSISRMGICYVTTEDPEVARELGLWSFSGGRHAGEFPVGVLEQLYLLVYYAHVGGFRLPMTA
ncbi:MAG: hypothetical protein ACOY93_11180, partial [Bacillota bacterium]